MKHGKKYTDSVKLLEPQKAYDPEEALRARDPDQQSQV